MKKLVVSSLISFSLLAWGNSVKADEQEISFDLQKDVKQKVTFLDENGEETFLSIEREKLFSSPFLRVSNGTYTVSGGSWGAWNASYKISISGNKITSAHSSSVSAVTGSILGRSLSYNSTSSSLSITRKFIFTSTGYLCGKINNGKLTVSIQ